MKVEKIVEVRDPKTSSVIGLASLEIKTIERASYDKAIELKFKMLSFNKPKNSIQDIFVNLKSKPEFFSGKFDGRNVTITSGYLILDNEDLRGYRIGSFLMAQVVEWAKQWPDANVTNVKLLETDALTVVNKDRRNKFYENFGLTFEYSADKTKGVSRNMKAKDLIVHESWKQNISVLSTNDIVAALLKENIHLKSENKRLDVALKDLIKSRREDCNKPFIFLWNQMKYRFLDLFIKGGFITLFGIAIYKYVLKAIGY